MRRVELARHGGRRETLVQPTLEALNLVFTGLEVVAWPIYSNYQLLVSIEYGQLRRVVQPNQNELKDAQFEERVGDLEHEDVWVAVVVHDEDALDGAPHPEVFIVVLEPL